MTDLVNAYQPEIPLLGTGNLSFDANVERLDRFIYTRQEPDILFFGNSMMGNGLDPAVVEHELRGCGIESTCFTFGVRGASPVDYDLYLTYLWEKCDNPLMVVGVSPLLYVGGMAEGRTASIVSESDWGRYEHGDWNLAGCLASCSWVERYMIRLHYILVRGEEDRRLRTWNRRIREDGFDTQNQYDTTGDSKNWRRFRRAIRWPEESPETIELFWRSISRHPHVVLLEMPVNPAIFTISGMDRERFAILRNRLKLDAAANGLPLWRVDAPDLADPLCWGNLNHMTPSGARRFSKRVARWIGEQNVLHGRTGEL